MMNKSTVWTNTGYGLYKDSFPSAMAAMAYREGIIHAMCLCCWLEIVNEKEWPIDNGYTMERMEFSNGKTIYIKYKF